MDHFTIKLFIICSACSFTWPLVEGKLLHVISITNHGHRSPLGPGFESNPYANESFWPDGYSQLTIEGKRCMYWVGQNVGQMYSGTLYNGDPRNVKVYALDIDRCIESAQLFATGLNPPIGRWIWNSDQLQWWQPHRIHQIAEANYNCSHVYSDKEWLSIEKKYSGRFKKLSIYTGTKISIRNMFQLYDSLVGMKKSGKQLPDWCSGETFNFLEEVYTETEKVKVSNEKCIRERSGFLFEIISETLKNIRVNTVNNMRYNFTILNVRDVNLMAFLGGLTKLSSSNELKNLNINLNISPYGATVLIEIYDEPWRVKINYVEQAESFNPEPLFISSCGDTLCPLEQFVSICNQYK